MKSELTGLFMALPLLSTSIPGGAPPGMSSYQHPIADSRDQLDRAGGAWYVGAECVRCVGCTGPGAARTTQQKARASARAALVAVRLSGLFRSLDLRVAGIAGRAGCRFRLVNLFRAEADTDTICLGPVE